MGEDALEFLNALEFPLAEPVEPKLGELQRFTPTIQALYVPDIDASLDEQPAKTAFWNAFKALGPGGPSCRPTDARAVAAFVALAAGLGRLLRGRTSRCWDAVALVGRRSSSRSSLIPAVFGLVCLALPLWRTPPLQLSRSALAFVALAVVLAARRARGPVRTSRSSRAMTAFASAFLRFFESVSWVVLVALIMPWVDAYSVWRGPTNTIVTQAAAGLHDALVRLPGPGRRPAAANLGLPDLLFFALFLGAAARFGCARRLDVARADALVRRRRWRSRPGSTSAACPRCRCSRSASCSRTPTCSGRRCGGSGRRSRARSRTARDRRPSATRPRRAPAAAATAIGLCRRRNVTRGGVRSPGSTTETVLASMFGTQSSPLNQALASGIRADGDDRFHGDALAGSTL